MKQREAIDLIIEAGHLYDCIDTGMGVIVIGLTIEDDGIHVHETYVCSNDE